MCVFQWFAMNYEFQHRTANLSYPEVSRKWYLNNKPILMKIKMTQIHI